MDLCKLYNSLQNYLYVKITVMWAKQSMTGNGLYHLYKIVIRGMVHDCFTHIIGFEGQGRVS